MSNKRPNAMELLEELGGEPLNGSGFEAEVADRNILETSIETDHPENPSERSENDDEQ